MEEITQVLEKHKIMAPTPIQNLAIPELLKGKNALMTAQTGTGKTLAYCTPLIHILKMQELKAGIRLTIPHRPRSLIVVPNRELAMQVEEVFKMFMYDIPLKLYSAYPGTKLKTEFMKIEQGIDVMITTPDRLVRHRDAKKIFLSNLTSLVIDEWDTLLDSGLEEFIYDLVDPIVKKSRSAENSQDGLNKQVVFWSATVTKPIESLVAKYWSPGDKTFVDLVEKNTHMNLANLDHEFIKLSEKDKYNPLEMILKEFRAYRKETNTSAIVFCNSIQAARAAEHTISELGYKVSSLHGDIPPRMRNQYFEDFKWQKTDILVSTDLGSRGLDFPFVSHVINLDFPRTISDYIHRAGRAGRAGRLGYVKSFYRNYDSPIIEEMRKSHEESTPMQIESSAFALRKTFETPIGSRLRPQTVSEPGKRKYQKDPLAVDKSMLIRTYNKTGQGDNRPKRVLNFKNKAKAKDPMTPVKESMLKHKIHKKFEKYMERKVHSRWVQK
jgi:superfamily II DNA/RNA helicase